MRNVRRTNFAQDQKELLSTLLGDFLEVRAVICERVAGIQNFDHDVCRAQDSFQIRELVTDECSCFLVLDILSGTFGTFRTL